MEEVVSRINTLLIEPLQPVSRETEAPSRKCEWETRAVATLSILLIVVLIGGFN